MSSSSSPTGVSGRESATFDREIGRRLRKYRVAARVSQTELGSALGVTFQQVQKYEKGLNRLSAGALWQAAHYFNVPIALFFRDLDTPSKARTELSKVSQVPLDFAASREGQRWRQAYLDCANPSLKRIVLELLQLSQL